MLKITLLLSLVVVCLAQEPFRCSTPLQWEGRRIRTIQSSRFSEIGTYSYDALGQRTRAIEEIFQGDEREFYDVLHLYAVNKTYRINERTRNCTVSTPSHPFFAIGIPQEAKFMFEAEVGAAQIEFEHMTIQTWSATFSDGNRYGITVTVPDCIPVGAEYMSKTLVSETYSYFNIRRGILDPAVFNVPTECAGL